MLGWNSASGQIVGFLLEGLVEERLRHGETYPDTLGLVQTVLDLVHEVPDLLSGQEDVPAGAYSNVTSVVESKKKDKRTVIFDKTLFPRSRYGSLSAGSREVAMVAYSFDKMTLSKDQMLKVYFYESSGQRNLVLPIDTNDINQAASPL